MEGVEGIWRVGMCAVVSTIGWGVSVRGDGKGIEWTVIEEFGRKEGEEEQIKKKAMMPRQLQIY